MVHEIVDIAGLEFMENRHRNCSVGQCREEADAPVGLISRADGYLVTFHKTALLECDMKFCDSSCYISVGEILSFVVRQRGTVPVFLETRLKEFVY